MIYTADITTAANTSKVDALRTRLTVTKGLVYQVEFDAPFGSAGLLHCQVFDGGHQLWPSSLDASFNSPGFVISFADTYLKKVAPFRFDIMTWNLDDSLEHFMQVRIGLVSEAAFIARFMPTVAIAEAQRVLDELRERQEADRQAIIAEPFVEVVEGE